MKIPLAKEGYIFIIPLGLLAVLFWVLSLPWVAGFFGLGFLFVTWFFRDPERAIPNEPNVVVSPADGKVVEIITEKDPILGELCTRISIFLNVFNVHVNRVPIGGKIKEVRYNPGKFLAAFNHKASLDNEQTIILINNGKVNVFVKQIAGLIARRIICWAKQGDSYEVGQRYGLIRFGSRVDILLPQDTQVSVACGDHVSGGRSIIGYLNES